MNIPFYTVNDSIPLTISFASIFTVICNSVYAMTYTAKVNGSNVLPSFFTLDPILKTITIQTNSNDDQGIS